MDRVMRTMSAFLKTHFSEILLWHFITMSIVPRVSKWCSCCLVCHCTRWQQSMKMAWTGSAACLPTLFYLVLFCLHCNSATDIAKRDRLRYAPIISQKRKVLRILSEHESRISRPHCGQETAEPQLKSDRRWWIMSVILNICGSHVVIATMCLTN